MLGSRRRPFRNFAAACLVIVIGQALVPPGAVAVAPQSLAAQSQLSESTVLMPNLVVLKAADLYVQHTSQGRYLRFESGLGNIGRGPLEVRPNSNQTCPAGQQHATQIMYRDDDSSRFFRRDIDIEFARRSAGCMVFHVAHDHWHFQAASRYRLFEPGEDTNLALVGRRKMSFCLRDSRRLPAQFGSFNRPAYYGGCSRNSAQGISTGWADVYQSFLAGQAVRLPASAGNGLYCLETKVDPRNLLVESNDDDNTSMRAFRLKGDSITFDTARLCN